MPAVFAAQQAVPDRSTPSFEIALCVVGNSVEYAIEFELGDNADQSWPTLRIFAKVAIGISTSGGSRNIIMALEEARKRNMLTVALLGYDGGEIKRRQLADFPIVVQCDYIPRIQEVQASIYHIIRETLEVLRRGQA